MHSGNVRDVPISCSTKYWYVYSLIQQKCMVCLPRPSQEKLCNGRAPNVFSISLLKSTFVVTVSMSSMACIHGRLPGNTHTRDIACSAYNSKGGHAARTSMAKCSGGKKTLLWDSTRQTCVDINQCELCKHDYHKETNSCCECTSTNRSMYTRRTVHAHCMKDTALQMKNNAHRMKNATWRI